MLSIVEALQEFCTIVLGYPVNVHTNHLNLSHDAKLFKNARVMRWRLALEEFVPTLTYIPGVKNVVADALSRLLMDETSIIDDDLFIDECLDLW